MDTLLPKKLSKNDASYKTVEDLNNALSVAEEQNIKNIAITGPFGSGKSSVLYTLMKDFDTKDREYLPISLATLQANNEHGTEDSSNNQSNLETNKIENLNRKIEYSILQQLIYRETAATVPNSRFRRIAHLPHRFLCLYAGGMILTILAILILFEPVWLRVESLYQLFNFGIFWNTIFDCISAIWILYALFCLFKYILKSYANSKLNKLNLKDGEIELVEDNSIFNKHLDEILYFFQVTKYNVVIIEDLDRFGTSNIFLKLRELNQLVNESKIVGRHITFVYAIKDDVFKDEERTKFFDYITTVIPVINPSNSKDKLKELLISKGFEENEIPDDDLSEMAFFIQDMRILTNIVNEYKQYREKLCTDKTQKLNLTKLLAMIVYKNYYPQDFAQLHRREGKVYSCISKKRIFVEDAIKVIENRKKEIQNEEKAALNEKHIKIEELRLLLLYKIKNAIDNKMCKICIGNKSYVFEDIAKDNGLFDKLITQSSIRYEYFDDYNRVRQYPGSINLKTIDKDTNYLERISLIKKDPSNFQNEYQKIKNELIAVKSLRLKDVISLYNLSESELYHSIHLSPMQDIFLRRGYIDEEYYDYISYFYEGMVSLSDRELLLNVKRQICQPYDYHIDKVGNFVKELKPYMFEYRSILNIDLLDYIASTHGQRENFDHFMKHLENENPKLDFLVDYYTYGKCNQVVFDHIVRWNKTKAWEIMCVNSPANKKETLTEAYLKYSGELEPNTQTWVNSYFKYLTNHVYSIGLERCLEIARKSKFDSIQAENEDILDCVIENDNYTFTIDNLFVVVRRLIPSNSTINTDTLNYTRILATQNNSLLNNVNKNIDEVIKLLPDKEKDESTESILFILNNDKIEISTKEFYLKSQHNQIPNFDGIIDSSLYILAIRDFLVVPNWKNVMTYYNHCKKITEDLVIYMEHYASELAAITIRKQDPANELFEKILANDILSISTYKSFTTTFASVFDYSCEDLKTLDMERLKILINKEKLMFNQDVLNIINDTSALCHYIEHFYPQFRSHYDWSYKWTEELAIMVLNKEEGLPDTSLEVVNAIPKFLRIKPKLANKLASIYLKKKDAIDEDEDVSMAIISNCKDEKASVLLAIRQMKLSNGNSDTIGKTLCTLDNKYAVLTDKSKRPLFEGKHYQIKLLDYLKEVGYIASYKTETKDKNTTYRVYPTKSKE